MQVPLHESIFGEDAIVVVACVAAVRDAADLVAFLKRLRYFAADFLDDAGVVAAEDGAVGRDAVEVVFPVCGI